VPSHEKDSAWVLVEIDEEQGIYALRSTRPRRHPAEAARGGGTGRRSPSVAHAAPGVVFTRAVSVGGGRSQLGEFLASEDPEEGCCVKNSPDEEAARWVFTAVAPPPPRA
jgi:hypothetical protein